MALDKTESAILGAVVALALGGAVLWLTGGTSTPEPVQPAPLPPAAGAPPAGSGQGTANPVQQINDILQGAAKGGLKLPPLPGQTAPQGGSATPLPPDHPLASTSGVRPFFPTPCTALSPVPLGPVPCSPVPLS